MITTCISISTHFLGHTHRETIFTRNSITIINHLSLNALTYFIMVTKSYLCSYVSILWSDLESSRMCLWNKIPIPPFGARSNVYHPCISSPMSLWLRCTKDTIKFLNFRMPENFAVIYLKFKQRAQTLGFSSKRC